MTLLKAALRVLVTALVCSWNATAATTVVAWGDNSGITNIPAELTNVVAVSAGIYSALALKADGTVIRWDSAPVTLSGPGDVIAVAGGWAHDILVHSNGTVDVINAMGPPVGLSNVIAASAEVDYSWALCSDGSVTGWSRFSNGGSIATPILTNAIAISSGVIASLALKMDGGVEGFGLVPPGIPLEATNAAALSQGWAHSLVARSDGTVVSFGQYSDQPVVPAGLSNVVDIAAGEARSLALKTDGTVVGWNYDGSLLTDVPPGLTNVVAIAAGRNFTLALVNDGSLFFSKQPVNQASYRGQRAFFSALAMGRGNISYQWKRNGVNLPEATNRVLKLANVQPINAGTYSVTASNASGTLESRRANLAVVDAAPFILTQPTDQTVLHRSNSMFSSLANGALPLRFQWQFNGANLPGETNASLILTNVQFGNAGSYCLTVSNAFGSVSTRNALLSVVTSLVIGWNGAIVPVTATNVIAITGGDGHTVALRDNGVPMAWGDNTVGQTNVPPGVSNVVAVSAGASQTLALLGDTTVTGWGISWQNFPVGMPPNLGPLQIPAGLSNVVAIASGRYHGLALKRDNSVATWGSIRSSSSSYTSPAPPANLVNVVAIASGLDHSLALKKNGTVVAWGRNAQGQINVPVGLANVISIAAGQYHSVALKSDGSVAVWGNLGVPSDLTNAVTIASGMVGDSLALRGDGTLFSFGYQSTIPQAISNVIGFTGSTAILNDGSPFIVRRPLDAMLSVGQSWSLSAAVSGTPPLYFQWHFNGAALPGATNLSLTLTNALISQSGNYSFVVSNLFGVANGSNVFVDVFDPAKALNATNLVWTNTGDIPWFWQDGFTHDGIAALQSGATNVGQTSVLGTTVTGPGTLTFWLKTSASYSPPGGSTIFSINGVPQFSQSGQVDWSLRTHYLGDGLQLLQWNYTKHSSQGWPDTAWLDQVSYSPGPTLPTFSLTPTNQALTAGENVSFQAAAYGTPPLHYQWRFNGDDLPGITNSNLTVSNAQSGKAGTYTVTVTNGYGMVAASANLTVVPAPPTVTTQPIGGRFIVGNSTILRVNAKGSEPLSFQWQFNGSNIPGATSPMLVLSDLAETNSGIYRAVVSNVVSAALSSNASLVVSRSLLFAWGNFQYGQTNIPFTLTNPVSASFGERHGLGLRENGTIVVWGNNTYGQTNVPSGLSNVIAIACGGYHNLALRSNGSVVTWGAGTNTFVSNPHYRQSILPTGITNVAAISAGAYHSLALNRNGTVISWGRFSEGQTNTPPQLKGVKAIAAGGYHNLALNADCTVTAWGAGTNYATLPARGQCVVPANLTNVIGIAAGAYHSLALKADGKVVGWGDNSYGQTNVPVNLNNVIAIAAGNFHNIALTDDGSIACWGAGTNNSQFPDVHYGQSIVPSTLSNVVVLAGGAYVSGAIINDRTPFFASQPLSRTIFAGDEATFSITAVNSLPLTFQWTLNGLNLTGDTNAMLTITNAPLTSAGIYQCVASNLVGSTASQPVTLIVLRRIPVFDTSATGLVMTPAGLVLRLAGLSGSGPITVYTSTNLADWYPISTNPPILGQLDFLDPAATNAPLRFYRAVEN